MQRVTTLDGALTATATSIVVADSSKLPINFGFKIQLDEEKIWVSVNTTATNTLTVNRGQDGTTPVAHDDGEDVFLLYDDVTLGKMHDHVVDISKGKMAQAAQDFLYDQPTDFVIREDTANEQVWMWVVDHWEMIGTVGYLDWDTAWTDAVHDHSTAAEGGVMTTVYLFDKGGEYISGDGTDLTFNSGGDIALTATGDVNIPANVGVTFGDDGEKIEGDGTDLTITSSGKLNLNSTGVITASNQGIADNAVVTIDHASVADNDYAKFTANGLEGRSYAEVRSDINVEDGADVTDSTNVTAAGALMDSEIPTQGFINLLNNCNFETGTGGWTIVGTGSTGGQSATQVKFGSYSLSLTRSGTNCRWQQAIPDGTDYIGKTMTLSCWVWASVASRARVVIYDGVNVNASSTHSGGSAWELLSVTATMDGSATNVSVYLQVLNGDTTAYFDAPMLVEGSLTPAVIPNASTMHSFSLSSTRDMTAASGDVSYTGVGFRPRAIFAIAGVTTVLDSSIGFCDYSLTELCVSYDYTAKAVMAAKIIQLTEAAGKAQDAIVKSLDDDGFTLTWTKTGTTSAGTATLYFLCLR
jgi:hypothetical protein